MSIIIGEAVADEHHRVLSVKSERRVDDYQRRPCAKCPWRKDAVGEFPAEAFRISATTAQELSERTFGCHAAGAEQSKTCAGYLMSSSADHNLSVRLSRIERGGLEDIDVTGLDLFPTYRDMAVANGVHPDDPALGGLR